MTKFKAMFLSETGEHLRSMHSLLGELGANPEDREGINALFREAHSIKGMAASMGYERMAALAHHLEDFLEQFRKEGSLGETAIDRLVAGVDLLEGLLEDLAGDLPERDVSAFLEQPEPAATHEQPETETAAEHTYHLQLTLQEDVPVAGARLLLALKQLESLGTITSQFPGIEQIMAGEADQQLQITLRSGFNQQEISQAFAAYPEIAEIAFNADPPPEERRQQDRRRQSLNGGTVRVDTQLLDRFIDLTGELITNRHMLQTALHQQEWRELQEGLGQLGKLVKKLHGQVLQVRMMAATSITERLPRVVRELCRNSGKEVHLNIEGAEIELDRTILEELADPLVHMVRNAIDHGIELQGTVHVKIRRERSHVEVQVKDDGRGIDPQQLRRRAVEKGLVSAEQARTMGDAKALQLICLPGFSTTEQVTETSGRGVGMDVVKAAVEKLGGTLLIDSVLGQGSCLTMQLPLSVAIIRILLVECDNRLLALPITRLLQTHLAERQEVQSSGRQLIIEHKGEKLPLLSLRKILGMPVPPAASQIAMVIMDLFGRKVGLVVDRIAGHQEVYVKKLPAPFDRLAGNNGGAILGDGQVVFILDVQGLLERRRNKG